ncbi:alpha/beta fold hydrolase [Oscillatoriales cyanobacterium LEGE 11467]|uniref:Alpha/beta fold hydrolase n=1 Tax=Zarconia navalis LEGE 11467 TaxID=1828826 RepID=A0A928W167_9CYAN|nr:alpha/beta fold hydrolase [Zarconia navalis]MBE9041385.1 alpha/beta fold hydrolase [Zarconia navalis LEGE 11467]
MTTQQVIETNAIKKQFWQWQGHKIQYAAIGTGQPLVLIHGFGASIGHWRKNIPVLAQAGYQVFALDLLGFGGSDKAPISYSLELWQSLLQEFWATHINRPTVWIGNSIGALLALMMAAHHGEMTAGAVLLNCAGGLNHRPEELTFPLRWVMGSFTKLIASKSIGPFLFDRIRAKHRIRRTLYQVYRNRGAVTDELVELLYRPSCDAGAGQVFASILTAPAGPSPAQLLPQVRCPLLVLWGENDPWTPVKGGQIFQQTHSSASIEFISIPNAGHCPHDEHPEIVNSHVLHWLEGHSALFQQQSK